MLYFRSCRWAKNKQKSRDCVKASPSLQLATPLAPELMHATVRTWFPDSGGLDRGESARSTICFGTQSVSTLPDLAFTFRIHGVPFDPNKKEKWFLLSGIKGDFDGALSVSVRGMLRGSVTAYLFNKRDFLPAILDISTWFGSAYL